MRHRPSLVPIAVFALLHAACGDAPHGNAPSASRDARNAAAPQPSRAETTGAAALEEACNGFDDDGDGVIDQGDVCARACAPANVDALVADAELPSPDTQTVPAGSTVRPELTAITRVPDACLQRAPLTVTRESVLIPCGARVEVDASGLAAGRVVVQPGGVLRIVADATVTADHDFLLCPGALVQGAKPTRAGVPAASGAGLTLRAERILLLGSVLTHASYTDLASTTASADAVGGHVELSTERLLMSGLIDSAGDAPPAGFHRGEGGFVSILATKESFFGSSSKIVSGNAHVDVPVL